MAGHAVPGAAVEVVSLVAPTSGVYLDCGVAEAAETVVVLDPVAGVAGIVAGEAVEGQGSHVELGSAHTGSIDEVCVRFAGEALVDSGSVAGLARRMASGEGAIAGDGH